MWASQHRGRNIRVADCNSVGETFSNAEFSLSELIISPADGKVFLKIKNNENNVTFYFSITFILWAFFESERRRVYYYEL